MPTDRQLPPVSGRRNPALPAAPALLAVCLMLASCGGDDVPPQATVPSTPEPSSGSVSGFAATGKALPEGSAVQARCVSGGADGSTTATGAYTLSTKDAVLPCLLRATYGSGESKQRLYSFAAAEGTVQITPFTHALVVKALGGIDPEALFAAPDETQLRTLALQLPDGQTALRKLLTDLGLNTPPATLPSDFFAGPLQPATALAAGDAHDQLIDAAIARFGVVDALTYTFRSVVDEPDGPPGKVVDLGISARVDWSQCAIGPYPDGDGYSGRECRPSAVILSGTTRNYGGDPSIKMTLGAYIVPSSIDNLIDAECYGYMDGTRIGDSPTRPAWASGSDFYLTGFGVALRRSDGSAHPDGIAYNAATIFDSATGRIRAVSSEPGARITELSASGSTSWAYFEGGYLQRMLLRYDGFCKWGTNDRITP